MSVFKNKVGRPSKETIKKRKIIKIFIFLLCLLLILSTFIILSNKFEKKEVIGNEKNIKTISISFTNYNTTKPVYGQTVTFKHNIINAKNKYQNWYLIQDGIVIKEGTCTKINTNNYIENDSLSPISNKTKKIKVMIYSDKKCTRKVKEATSNNFTWPKEEKNITDPQTEKKINTDKKIVIINDLDNNNFTEETAVNILLDMYNYKDKYYKIDIYSEGKYYKNYSKGQIKYNYYYVNVLLNIFNKEYINLSICEDSACSKIINEYKSKTYTVKNISSTNNVIDITEPSVKNYFKEQTISFKFNIKNSKSKYYIYNTYTNGAKQYSSKCIKIDSNSYSSGFNMLINKDVVSGRYAEVLLYNNSNCKTEISKEKTSNYNFINIKYDDNYIYNENIISMKNNQKLDLKYTITGGFGKYYNYYIYNYSNKKIIVKSKCTYINTNNKTSSILIGPYSKNTKVYVQLNLYDTSACSNNLTSLKTNVIKWS